MADYPAAGASTGYVYDRDFDIPMAAYNNAKVAGSFTATRATTTTVSDVRIRAGELVMLTAKNADGAAVFAGVVDAPLGIYVSSVVDGGFVVTHDDSATVDGAQFYYAVLRIF
jgi:hypothetical protein